MPLGADMRTGYDIPSITSSGAVPSGTSGGSVMLENGPTVLGLGIGRTGDADADGATKDSEDGEVSLALVIYETGLVIVGDAYGGRFGARFGVSDAGVGWAPREDCWDVSLSGDFSMTQVPFSR